MRLGIENADKKPDTVKSQKQVTEMLFFMLSMLYLLYISMRGHDIHLEDF